jgi:thioredoxin reductase (NADPH)
MQEIEYKDLLIIGAGPAGISMAVEAQKAGIESQKITVIEKSQVHSFSIRRFYPENKVVTANYKGKEANCTGSLCLIDSSKSETLSFLDFAINENKVDVRYQETVWKIEKNEDSSFTIQTDKALYNAKSCVIAIGVFGKPNKPSYKIPSEIKKQVHFDITSIPISNTNILVVGGGDSASEYVQYLVHKKNTVSLSYRRSDLARMNKINSQSLNHLSESSNVELLLNTNIKSLESSNQKVKVNFESEIEPKYYDHVVYALGGSTPVNFLKEIGIEFNGKDPIVTSGFETTIAGLYLVGDLSAGKKGGSIISAFNSAHEAMESICQNHLECTLNLT